MLEILGVITRESLKQQQEAQLLEESGEATEEEIVHHAVVSTAKQADRVFLDYGVEISEF